MKFWNVVLKVTISRLILFIVMIFGMMLKYFIADADYPYPALGIDIANWFDAFVVSLAFQMIIVGIPLLINIILLIVSIVKIRSVNKK